MYCVPWILWVVSRVYCSKGVSAELHISQSWKDSRGRYQLLYINGIYNDRGFKNRAREGSGLRNNGQLGNSDVSCGKGGIIIEDGQISDDKRAGNELKHFKCENNTDVYPIRGKGENSESVPKLPSREFKPKKSLGQNFITDLNIIKKICNSLRNNESVGDGSRVVELGCGLGSLTKVLFQKYPKMTGIEIDKRAVVELSYRLPELNLINEDILQVNYKELSEKVNQKLWVIGNLPFYITSQILLYFLDFKKFIDRLVITCQLEVANNVFGGNNSSREDNNILSVLYRTFTNHKILFKIPKHVFYPSPKVDAALVYIDFNKNFKFQNYSNNNSDNSNNCSNMDNSSNNNNNCNNNNISNNPTNNTKNPNNLQYNNNNTNNYKDNNNDNNYKDNNNEKEMEEVIKYNILKYLLKYSFNQKRKKLKNSLLNLLSHLGIELPERFWDKRAQNVSPKEYVELTNYVYENLNLSNLNELISNKTSDDLILNRNINNLLFNSDPNNSIDNSINSSINGQIVPNNESGQQSDKIRAIDRIWRKNKHGPGIQIKDLI